MPMTCYRPVSVSVCLCLWSSFPQRIIKLSWIVVQVELTIILQQMYAPLRVWTLDQTSTLTTRLTEHGF